MTKETVYDFIRQHALAVIATSNKDHPEAALVGIAISDDLEIIFDTVKTTRKYVNLVHNPNVAIVVGWHNETTLQYEGVARVLSGAEDEKYREIYYGTFADGRQRAAEWPDIVHFIVSPKWIRYSDFGDPQLIEEMKF